MELFSLGLNNGHDSITANQKAYIQKMSTHFEFVDQQKQWLSSYGLQPYGALTQSQTGSYIAVVKEATVIGSYLSYMCLQQFSAATVCEISCKISKILTKFNEANIHQTSCKSQHFSFVFMWVSCILTQKGQTQSRGSITFIDDEACLSSTKTSTKYRTTIVPYSHYIQQQKKVVNNCRSLALLTIFGFPQSR